ncbi:unnamed protein product [Penicillium salamii]|nr:unnamed protein product [Penicillium salamii]
MFLFFPVFVSFMMNLPTKDPSLFISRQILSTTSILLCPSEIESLSPANKGDLHFNACAMICQFKFLRLYFHGRRFEEKQLDQLGIFLAALRDGRLQAKAFDRARHGLAERDWRVFSLSLDPPPYSEQHVSEKVQGVHPPLYCAKSESQQVVGKRRRVNPPNFTHTCSPSRTESANLTRLVHELYGVSDDLIRELLIRSRRQHLLAKPEEIASDLPCEFEKVGSAQVERLERRLTQYVNKTSEQRLDQIVDSAVGECRDQVYDEFKTDEAEFREHLDDDNSELRNTANDCMEEAKKKHRNT